MLTSVQNFGGYFTVSEESGYKTKHLRDLNKLRGRLCIFGLENVKSNEEALEAKLADKERLAELVLWWECDQESCNPEVEVEVLEGLCPPKGLEKLELRRYSGVRYPNWMVGRQNGGLKFLQVLELQKCSLLGLAPVFEAFTQLRVLSLRGCNWVTLPDNIVDLKSLEELSIKLCDIQSLPVLPQSLKKLCIECCQYIQSLPVLPQALEELSIDNCLNIQSLSVLPQSLTKLSVIDCLNFKSLPELPQSLEKFILKRCGEVLQTEDPNWQNIQPIHKKKNGPSSSIKGVHFDDNVPKV